MKVGICCSAMVLVGMLVIHGQSHAQNAPNGVPLNKGSAVSLGEDLGFGKKYRRSMGNNFQSWGLQKVSKERGHPVRLGNHSLRFETREGFCGWEPRGWNDCRKGRSRHELSTAANGSDSWNKEYWYSVSVFVPENYSVDHRMGNSMMQFLAGGKPSWMIKFDDFYGFFLQREFDYERRPIAPSYSVKSKWNDVLIRVVHSTRKKGRFTLWHNGRMVVDHKGQTSRKVSSKRRPYFKFGIYNTAFNSKGNPVDGRSHRNGKGMPNLVLYYDEIRVAGTCKELKLQDLGYNCEKFLK